MFQNKKELKKDIVRWLEHQPRSSDEVAEKFVTILDAAINKAARSGFHEGFQAIANGHFLLLKSANIKELAEFYWHQATHL